MSRTQGWLRWGFSLRNGVCLSHVSSGVLQVDGDRQPVTSAQAPACLSPGSAVHPGSLRGSHTRQRASGATGRRGKPASGLVSAAET